MARGRLIGNLLNCKPLKASSGSSNSSNSGGGGAETGILMEDVKRYLSVHKPDSISVTGRSGSTANYFRIAARKEGTYTRAEADNFKHRMHGNVKLILQAQASNEDIDRLSQPVKNLVHYLFSLNKEAATEGLPESMTTFERLSVPVTAAFQNDHHLTDRQLRRMDRFFANHLNGRHVLAPLNDVALFSKENVPHLLKFNTLDMMKGKIPQFCFAMQILWIV